jgi:hypothetical protein
MAAFDVIVLGAGHPPYESLAALPESLRRRMRLVHYADSFDTAASVIRVLSEGDVVSV